MMQTHETAATTLAGISVFVAEDEALIAMDLEDMLLAQGADLVASPVGSCREAIAVLSNSDVHVALLDVSLRDGEVFPVAEELVRRDVPVAFHSGHATRHELEKMFPNSSFIAKPAHGDEIIETILKLAGRRR